MFSLRDSFKFEMPSASLEGPGRTPEAKCAKRTQFLPATGGHPRANMQNEPNLVPARAVAGGNCAKQSQTWGDWAMWAGAVVWASARPGSETCKTNPILPRARWWAQPTLPRERCLCSRETCKTKPNLGELEYMGKGRRMGRGSAGE
jgi:hypothetical protein